MTTNNFLNDNLYFNFSFSVEDVGNIKSEKKLITCIIYNQANKPVSKTDF